METKQNDLLRLAEGKMTLERFRQSYDIFEPLTDEEYLAIVNRNYLYGPIQEGKSYKMIRVENGNRTGVPNETVDDRKAIDYANSVTIDFFEIGKLQRQLQKEVRTASLISKVDEIKQQIEALWVKLFGNNKPSICSVIPRTLLIDIYDNFSDYFEDYYNDSNHFADEVLCDNPIRVKEGIKKWIQHLITVLLQKLNDASLKKIPQTKIYITLFPTRKKVRGRSLNIEEEKQNKSYQKNETLIDKIEDYLNLFDAKKYIS